ncbi:MAG TPA: cation transporter [Acidimicrobiia bacterium]|nr:cation transporter [Acidimicrobiia bacterium]
MTAPAIGELRRRGLWLEYITIGWNLVEAVVAVAAGLAASSIALIGFGFDSTIEVAAASVVVWQFRSEMLGGLDEEREQRALRMIAVTFIALAAYVTFEAVRTLLTQQTPETSTVGIVVAAASLVVMPVLAWLKRQTALRMGSETLLADSAETFLCAWLSAILLGGLVLNSTLGWWWADPIAALGIAYLAVREGLEAWSGDHHDH